MRLIATSLTVAKTPSDAMSGLATVCWMRYEHDELAQLLLITEQLEVAGALLRTDSIAHARAALILLDHHAEIMLNRHFESLFRAGDGKGPLAGRPYKRGERQKLREFGVKVDAAAGVGPLGQGVPSVLDADGAACLKLAHRNRNAAYHFDQHNPGVLELICLLQLSSVCHLLPATMERVSISFAGKDLPEALVRHGVKAQDMSGLRSAIELPVAAQQVAVSITAELELPLSGVKGALVSDLLGRGGTAIRVIQRLLEDGLPSDNLHFAIAHSEFWERHGSDAELVELLQRADSWHRRGEADANGRFPAEVQEDMETANRERNERYVELQHNFRPQARDRAVIDAIEKSEELLELSTLAEVVELYNQLDHDLSIFERHLPTAVGALNARIERQMDYALER
jgi:hypothetical protein